jgi:hypothetical protein
MTVDFIFWHASQDSFSRDLRKPNLFSLNKPCPFPEQFCFILLLFNYYSTGGLIWASASLQELRWSHVFSLWPGTASCNSWDQVVILIHQSGLYEQQCQQLNFLLANTVPHNWGMWHSGWPEQKHSKPCIAFSPSFFLLHSRSDFVPTVSLLPRELSIHNKQNKLICHILELCAYLKVSNVIQKVYFTVDRKTISQTEKS